MSQSGKPSWQSTGESELNKKTCPIEIAFFLSMRTLRVNLGDIFNTLTTGEALSRRLSRNIVYVDGNSKLANPLVNFGVASYTEQRSTLV